MCTHNTTSPGTRQFAQEEDRVWVCTPVTQLVLELASFPGSSGGRDDEPGNKAILETDSLHRKKEESRYAPTFEL